VVPCGGRPKETGVYAAAVPTGVELNTPVSTPDALDLLITSRNHDLKQAVARQAEAEDWILALVSLQTCEGFGGAKNYGIVRMNGGSSSRSLLALPRSHKAIQSPLGLTQDFGSAGFGGAVSHQIRGVPDYAYIGYPRLVVSVSLGLHLGLKGTTSAEGSRPLVY